MSLRFWLASLCRPIRSSTARPHRHARRLLYRLHLEVLEGRWLPSTFLVTTTDDAGAGSLRQAILDANATPGTNEIDFAIGGGGPQPIRPTSGLPTITRPVTIDGTTQPGFAGSPLIELSGVNTEEVSGLNLRTNNCTIQGLVINGFRFNPDYGIDFTAGLWIDGSGNVVQGNYIGTDASGTQALGQDQMGVVIASGSNNRIGGTAASQRNLISGNGGTGVYVYQLSSRTVLQGNYIGTDVTGTAALGNDTGIYIVSSNNNVVGGTTPGAGNLIAANTHDGVAIGGHISVGGNGNVVQGNYIGTNVTGTAALGNRDGVRIWGGSDNLIGGAEAGAGNLISGNASGVRIATIRPGDPSYRPQRNLVQGNLIGTDAAGAGALGNTGDGVVLSDVSASNNTIGGEAAGAGNTIAFNGGDGVLVDTGTSDAILGNAIFANGNQGIELLHGGNHDQAAPVLTSATTDGSRATVTGTLTSAPNSTFTLELFASSPGDPSGAERFVGSVQVTTDADGNASFTVTLDSAVDPGWFLTATATDFGNNTSRLAASVEVTG
jgi:hypothetical protein